jgi:tetratricopeptide (TPR) repeat protein
MRAGSRILALGLGLSLVLTHAQPARADALADGQAHLEAGRFAEAEEAFRSAVEARPDSAEAHYFLGLAHLRQDEDLLAAEAFEAALAIDPGLPGAHSSLGIAYYELGRHEEAEEQLERAVQLDPADAGAYLFLGLARWKQGETEPARQALERAIALEPGSPTAVDARELLQAIERGEVRSKPWSLYGWVGAEYDDDVSRSEVDATSGEKDVALVIELGGAYALVDRPLWQLEVAYDFYQSLYADEDDFDLQSHSLSLDGTRELGPVNAGLGYRLVFSTLDGDDFLDIRALRPSLGMLILPSWYVDLSFELQDRDFDQSARDSDRKRLGIANYLFVQDWGRLSFGYHRLDENADGPEFDYDGYELSLGLQAFFSISDRELELDTVFEYLDRDYDNITPSIGRKRDDRRKTLRIGVARGLDGVGEVRLDWERIDADSNLPSADYRQNVIRLSVGVDL